MRKIELTQEQKQRIRMFSQIKSDAEKKFTEALINHFELDFTKEEE